MDYKYDLIALGDTTIDNFIKLEDFHIHTDREKKEVCLSFGDKIPYKESIEVPAVGNSPNAAVAASRLGLKSALITNIGDDVNGKRCMESLEEDGVSTEYIKKHSGKKTNYHYVLQYQEERTILVKHRQYDYKMPELSTFNWLYLSSLGENSLEYHQEIGRYIRTHKESRLAFQPGTFQIKLGYEKLKDLYESSHIFFCNKQEAQRILGSKEDDITKLLKMMRELGPNIVVITEGPNGASTFDGREMWHMPMYPDPKTPVDRTGAGDSFASTLTAFLAMGFTVPEALERAPINSMSVVQYTGAQEGLLSREKLEQYLKNAPVDYKSIKIG